MSMRAKILLIVIAVILLVGGYFGYTRYFVAKEDLSLLVTGTNIQKTYDKENDLYMTQADSDQSLDSLKKTFLDYFASHGWTLVANQAIQNGGYRMNASKSGNSVGVFVFPQGNKYMLVVAQHYE